MKKDAEQSAAEQAVRALQTTDDLTELFGSPKEGDEFASTGATAVEADAEGALENWKGKLQEILVEKKTRCPVSASYATQKTGLQHAPTFQTTVTLAKEGCETPASFVGQRMDSKKDSEHSAARSAFQAWATTDGNLNELFAAPHSPPEAFALE